MSSVPERSYGRCKNCHTQGCSGADLLLYHKQVAASKHEFSYAQLEGVQFEYNMAPVEIKDDGVIFKDVIENEDGTFTDVPDSTHSSVLTA